MLALKVTLETLVQSVQRAHKALQGQLGHKAQLVPKAIRVTQGTQDLKGQLVPQVQQGRRV